MLKYNSVKLDFSYVLNIKVDIVFVLLLLISINDQPMATNDS